MEYYQLKIIFK